MLKDWLTDGQRRALDACRRVRQPFAEPAIATPAIALFEWETLARLLAADPSPDTLVVRRAELLDHALPRSLDDVRALFGMGAGLVVRRAERHDEGLRDLASRFEAEHGGRAHAQLFVTPEGMHGFGWHYDAEDVFILQTVGEKSYYFRANTQSPRLGPGERPDFGAIARETSPTATTTLRAGDALYLPRGTWHVARARTDSFHISLGLS